MRNKVKKNDLLDTISFRPETPEDHDFLLGLYASTRAAEMAAVDWPDAEKDRFVRMQFFAQSKHYKESYDAEWLIILRDGQPIGRLYLHQLEGDLRIVDITISPNQRGQGIGRM
ncbi:MAG TPA: GNAT family N-acetyltransferase, partial [Thermoanaerobaculia bacterium]